MYTEFLPDQAKFPTAVTFDVRRGDNPQAQQGVKRIKKFQVPPAPMPPVVSPTQPPPPPPTQPPPKFSPPSMASEPLTSANDNKSRKLTDEIVKVQSDQPKVEDYYRICFQ